MGRTLDTEITITRDGTEIEVLVSGTICGAEPDVGIMGAYLEDVCSSRLDTAPPTPIELTEEERERAETRILESYEDSWDDD